MALVPLENTAVGIDKDTKNAQYALRWAIDNLSHNKSSFVLVHVKPKNSQYQATGDNAVANIYRAPTEAERAWISAQFLGYCNSRKTKVTEMVVEENDIGRGLLDFINNNYITNIVIGASTRSLFSGTRKLKTDVSCVLNKSAPAFCSVYVISKSKVVSLRAAQRAAVNTALPPRQPTPSLPPPTLSDFDADVTPRGWRQSPMTIRERPGTSENVDTFVDGRPSVSRSSISVDTEGMEGIGFGSMDMSVNNTSLVPSTPERDIHRGSTSEVIAMIKGMRLELKQTMEMYSKACREALLAKKKAQELEDWKINEIRKMEEIKLAEEAALSMAESEKANCKAAMEAAEAARKLADMEVKRRRYAESKARRETEEKNRALTVLHKNDSRYRRYSIVEIEVATNKFADSMKIGEGGYGPVFKGKLDHTLVAIKLLRPDAVHGVKQFNREVEVLSCIRHPNMVLLLGVCPDYGCLVYEYLDNGSLDDRLFRRGNTPTLPCKLRFKIAVEITTALRFLHQTKPDPLVHRDLKPANILLNRNFVSKISDVGLSRLVPPSVADKVTQLHMTSAAGTFCYIDPEYQQTGMLGVKSDVYSLGILLLQMITARPPMALSHHVQRAIDKGTFPEVLDPTIRDWPLDETLRFARMALRCAELRKKDRPDLGSEVLPELKRICESTRGEESGSRSRSSNASYHHLHSE